MTRLAESPARSVHPAPLPTPPLTHRDSSPGLSSDGERSSGRKPAPLLTLSPSVLPPCDQCPQEEDISVIWNADVVKDGERLENLAWRHWGDHRVRRRSSSSTDTASSDVSIRTPVDAPATHHRRSCEGRRSFTNRLKLLVEETDFKDWIEEARHSVSETDASSNQGSPSSSVAAPLLSLPDTPTPNLEIRLVEPTPVPSRVGSLGASLTGSTVTASRPHSQPPVPEEEIEEEATPTPPAVLPPKRKARTKGGFFIQQSPSKASASSGSDASTAVSAEAAAEAAPETSTAVNASTERPERTEEPAQFQRSSAESSSQVVMKKKERRNVSMVSMRGRFQAEKRLASQAIAARKKAQMEADTAEDEDDDDEDWEDDDDEEEEEEEVDEEVEAEETAEAEEEGDDDDSDDSDDWVDESVQSSVAPSPRSKAKLARANQARFEMEKEQRKRDMFTKLNVDANRPKAPTEGLLTRAFRTGKSMVDLTQAGEEDNDVFRRTPTHGNFSTTSTSPLANTSALLRSKSVVAMPVHSGVSVTAQSHQSGTSDSKQSQRSSTSDSRGAPEGVELESSDEESEDDTYLASSQVRRKLDALAARRAARSTSGSSGGAGGPAAVPTPPAAASGDLDEHGIARPISPTSRRRMIIMREMSESLRRNIILEREKSSGRAPTFGHARPPPSVHTSRMPTVSSGLNLDKMNQQQGGGAMKRHHSTQLEGHRHETSGLERHASQPNLTTYPDEEGLSSVKPRQASISPTDQKRRQNLLGSGLLRPLTRADPSELSRTRSAATLHLGDGSGSGTHSPPAAPRGPARASSGFARASGVAQAQTPHLQAPPMVRSSTEGDQTERERKRELARRSDHTDTAYRFHGW